MESCKESNLASLGAQQIVAAQMQAIGTITEVHGPVVVVRCSRLPPLRQA